MNKIIEVNKIIEINKIKTIKFKTMKTNRKKRGISPLLATVLLIGFVIAIVAIVMLWGKGFVQEKAKKEGELSQKQLACSRVKMEVKAESDVIYIVNAGIEKIDGLIVRAEGIVVKCPKDKTCVGFEKMKQLDRFAIMGLAGQGITESKLAGKDLDVIPALIPEGIGAPLVPCPEQMKTIILSK